MPEEVGEMQVAAIWKSLWRGHLYMLVLFSCTFHRHPLLAALNFFWTCVQDSNFGGKIVITSLLLDTVILPEGQ